MRRLITGLPPSGVCFFYQSDDADILVELGYQLSLSGAFESAVEAYQAGARANEGDVRAMTGVVYCQVRCPEWDRRLVCRPLHSTRAMATADGEVGKS